MRVTRLTLAVAMAAQMAGAVNPCIASIGVMLESKQLQPVLMEMLIAASGKTPPFDAGKYAICQSIEEQTRQQVKTKHFIVHLSDWGILPGVPGEVGVCLPAACKDDDFPLLFKLFAAKGIPFLQNVTISTHYTGGEWPAPSGTVLFPNPFNNMDDWVSHGKGTIPAIVVICILGALVLFSTAFVSHAMRQSSRARAVQAPGALLDGAPVPPRPVRLPRALLWCEAFSLRGVTGTWTSLWEEQPKRPTDCLNGIKVVSMFMIVLGHTCTESMAVAGYRNAEYVAKSPFALNAASTSPWTYLLVCGQLTVDTFLFISGFLLSYVGKNRPVPVILGTVLRYCRLLPLFGCVMMIYTCIAPYLAFGPFSPRLQSDVVDNCKGTWWTELLFINDWYPWYTIDGGCMGWSWYLGVDMTFAIVGMVLLNTWKRNKLLGWAFTAILSFGCIALTAQQALYWKLDYDIINPSFGAYGHYIYERPFSRFPGFCIGLVAPWALDALEKRGYGRGSQPTSRFAKTIVYATCLVAVCILAACIWLPYTNTDGPGMSPPARSCGNFGCWSHWFNALWISLSRPIWCLAWLILTLACYFDYLPRFNALCSARIWSPLSTLTYGCYLIHPALIKVFAGNAYDYYTYSPADALSRASWNCFLAYGLAVVLWCIVEKPCATLTGYLVPKKGKSQRQPQQQQQSAA